MRRRPAPLRDAIALFRWVRLIRRIHPCVVVVGTPKASLLGITAALFSRVPNRIYVVHGLRFETMRWPLRTLSVYLEKWICAAATDVLSVSPSVAASIEKMGICDSQKLHVIHNGSPNGIDTKIFHPPSPVEKAEARESLGLPQDSLVVGFAGRLVRDKGTKELLEAFLSVSRDLPSAVLLLAGTGDDDNFVGQLEAIASSSKRIRFLGHLDSMSSFYRSLDVFCLPSYREGMPTVNLEAGASGLAIVTTSSTGCADSVIDGVSGLTVPARSPSALAEAIRGLLSDPETRTKMGSHGAEWVQMHFSQHDVWRWQLDFLETTRRRTLAKYQGT